MSFKDSSNGPEGNCSRDLSFLGLGLLILGLLWLFRAVLLGQGFFFGDFANQDLPKLFYNARELMQGNFPAWCPFHDLGRPYGQMAWHCIFYPVYLLLLPLSGSLESFERGLSLAYVAGVFWGALGSYLLLRFYGLSRQAATAGAAGAAYCASVIITMTSANNGAGYCWIPWIMLGLEQMAMKAKEGFSLKGWRGSALTGLAIGLCFLVAVIQRMPHMAAFLAAYVLFLCFGLLKERQSLGRFLAYLLGAILLGFCISAILLVPAAEYYANSARPDQDIYKNVADQCPWVFFLTNLVPGLFGRVMGPMSQPDWYLFWGGDNFQIGQFWQYWCRVSYGGLFGFLALLAAPAVFWRKKCGRGLFFLAVAIISILYIYGLENPLQYALAAIIKPLRSLRIPVRYAFFISMPLSFALAFLLDYVWPKEKQGISKFFWAFAAVSLLLIGLAYAVGANCLPEKLPAAGEARLLFNDAILRQVYFLAFGLGLYIMACKGFPAVSKWGLAALVVLDLATMGGNINNAKNSAFQENQENFITQDLRREAAKEGPNGRFRYRWDYVQANQKTVIWGLDSVNGYIMTRTREEEPLWNARKNGDAAKIRFDELWNIRYDLNGGKGLAGTKLAPWAWRYQAKMPVYDKPCCPRAYFVSRAIREDKDPAALVMVKDFNPLQIVVLSGCDPAPGTLSSLDVPAEDKAGSVTITDYRNQCITAKCSSTKPGYAVFSELYYPGFKAYVDGQESPILRANAAQRAVFLPEGEHDLVMKAMVSRQGLLIGLYSAGLLVGFLALLGWLVETVKIRTTIKQEM